MRPVRETGDGRIECQVVGCREPAQAWSYGFEVDELIVEIGLCPRHERVIAGLPPRCDGSPTCQASVHVENCVAGWAT